jgi:isopentenyl diphosphate isomerase/L-lactate dehydrogenase-like FMN-dependent dehydrogenase
MSQRSFPDGMERQLAIYMAGLEGHRPALPVACEALRERARETMSPEAFDYLDGGAGGGDTMRANREALDRRRIVPRHLRGVGARDMGVELLGRRLPAPVLLAPIGVQGIFHPDGELAVARAAASLGLPMVLSTVSSRTLEEVAGVSGDAPRWFQLYWPRDPELAESLLGRAEAAGYEAVVLTVDLPLLAWRERDVQGAYLPFLHGQGLANYLADPVFRRGLPAPEQDPRPAIAKFGQVFANPELSWHDIKWLRDRVRRPLLLKGILSADDARKAVDQGADGIVVSNHGGRQVDGAIGALDALPAVVEAVGSRVPVLFDSGIRRGADAVKALALGAGAVLLGRPYAYALAAGGEDGVRQLLLDFLADLDLTLALSGCRSIEDVDRSLLAEIDRGTIGEPPSRG